jgi:MFS family permease
MSGRVALEPFASRPFRLLFGGRLADNLASAITPIALAFAVLDLGGSPSVLGLVLACRTVPMIVLILFGGVVADRLPKHAVLVAANAVSALTQAMVATLLLTHSAQLWHLAAIEAVNGMSGAFMMPAASGLTPQTVPATQLQPANALLRLGHNATFVTGSAAGGLLVAVSGSGWAFAVVAVLFALGSALLGRIRMPRNARLEATTVLADLREGWSEFRSRTWLWVIVVQFAFVNAALSGAMNALGPVVADRTIGRAAWGLVLASTTAGMIAGGLIALRSSWKRPLLVGTLAMFLEVPLLLALGLQPETLLLMALAFVSGVGIETFTVAWDVSMQSNIPADRLSRVYAYDWFGSLVFIPVGLALAGPIAGIVGVRPTIVGAAVVVAVATAVALAVPGVRNLRRAEVPAAEPGDEVRTSPTGV